MDYTTCTTWTEPGRGHTRPFGPVFGDHPATRQVVECERCGQLWLFDIMDGEDFSGADDRLLWAPIPHAIREVQVGEITSGVAETLVPRLVMYGSDGDRIERVT